MWITGEMYPLVKGVKEGREREEGKWKREEKKVIGSV